MSASPRFVTAEASLATAASVAPRICFVGLSNLPVLAEEFSHLPVGGEQVQQTLLAKAFAARGYDVTMVTADYGQADGASWHGVRVYKAYAPDAGLPVVRFLHPRMTGTLAALRRADADVYYVSCAGAIVGQVALHCRRFQRRMIFRVASDADCAPDTLLIKHWRDRRLYEYGLKSADGVLAQSVRQQEMLERNYGVGSGLARMLVESSATAAAHASRDIDVLWVNNLRWMKRPQLFVELADELPHLSFEMAGGAAPGEQAYFEQAKAEAQRRANIRVLGQVPYHQVHSLYARARVYVSTSSVEGFPNSYIQSWAAGTPVVAFFDPDGLIAREGLGFAVGTLEEMRTAVERLTREEATWRATSERCRAYIAREFDTDKVLAPYRTLVESLAARRTR